MATSKKITHQLFNSWLETYKKAWETLDAELMVSIFAEDALYFETPFHIPITGKASLFEYWSYAPMYQSQVNFHHEIIGIKGMRGFCKWKISYFQFTTNEIISIDGILEVKLNSENACTVFKEWWHKKSEPVVMETS